MPFQDVIGHDRLISLLARSLHEGRLPPSLIFSGPSGIGKRLTAIAVAQALNCPARPSPEAESSRSRPRSSEARSASGRGAAATFSSGYAERDGAKASASGGGAPRELIEAACGTCSTCVRIAKGTHPDVVVVEPGETGSIKIEQVRDCVEQANYRPFEGRRRVVIVDNADAMMAPAQNALLKTLEEPPSASIFILVTARPDVLLPTVRSRCPRLTFRPLGFESLVRGLTARGVAERDARTIAASAEGSLGRALEMSAEDLVEARAVAQQVLAGAAASDNPARRIDGARAWLGTTGSGGAVERGRMATHLRAMASLLRDAELIAAGADAGELANADLRPALEGLATAYQGERGTRAFSAVDRALAALDRNAGVKIVADWLVLQL